jgi:hypothetical protein
MVEFDRLATGLLARQRDAQGSESLRVIHAGMAELSTERRRGLADLDALRALARADAGPPPENGQVLQGASPA